MPSPFGPWEDLVDVTTEGLFAAALVAGAVALWWTGRRNRMGQRPGWRPMVVGMSLLAVMATLDFTDEFRDALWVVAGLDTEPYLEDLLLPLGGVGLLVAGILRWVPMHSQLAELQADRQRAEIARLREMDEFKTTFLNTAAHELATPLTPIRVQLAIFQQESNQSPAMLLLDRNVTRLERLVKDLLDASRLQTGRLRFEMRRTDLGELVEEIRTSLAPRCEQESIDLRVEAGPDLVVEAADQARVSQVLYNLVGNAVKFAPGGSIRVSARLEGGEVVVAVEDTGAGLDPEELEGLFLPFQQYHRDLVGTHVGTGLGLYVSQGIAREHGGSITVHSEGRGRGSRFVLRLPVKAPAARPRTAPAWVPA